MELKLKSLVVTMVSWAAIFASQAEADQLADVKSKGTLSCGVLDIFEPFGYTDPQSRAVVGYDVDVCTAVAKKLGVKPDIRPVSIEARIPQLQQKHMDILSAGLAYTPQRAEQISFSDAYYVSKNIIAARSDKDYKQTSDVDGKRISYVKGSISEAYIKDKLPSATPVGFEDVSTGFTALVLNKVAGFSTSEEVLQKLITRLGPSSSKYSVLQPAIGREVWGLGVRKDEPAMLQAVNTALHDMEASGEMKAIFDKWLGQGTVYGMSRAFKVEAIK